MFVDPVERCALMCAPFHVIYSCENREDRECHCADGKTIKANKPDASLIPRNYGLPPMIRRTGPPHRPPSVHA